MLSRIHRGKEPLPPRLVLYGTEGIGKSTFASQAPAPIFIQTEDGLAEIDCDKFPLATRLEHAQTAFAMGLVHDWAVTRADGEMKADQALMAEMRARVHPDSTLTGPANLLVMPNLDAANISLNLLKAAQGEGITVGPILLGAAKPVHILTPSATVRRFVNITALAVAQAMG